MSRPDRMSKRASSLFSPLWFALPLLGVASVFAQANPPVVPVATPAISMPNWEGLTPQQRESLKPLASKWNSLPDARKRKWLAVAQNYERMAQPERDKLHARMAEWAALKPKEREQARLNFAETKKISPSERAATWEAYQALSAEEKQELANKGRKKLNGAAVAVKPAPKEKLASVPVTRRTPEEERARKTAKQAIDRNTLLPVAQRPEPAKPIEPTPVAQ